MSERWAHGVEGYGRKVLARAEVVAGGRVGNIWRLGGPRDRFGSIKVKLLVDRVRVNEQPAQDIVLFSLRTEEGAHGGEGKRKIGGAD